MEMAIGYILLSLIVGMIGRRTMVGFWGIFVFSIFLSPVITLIFVLLTGHRNKTIQSNNAG